jgi:hypothetical protein
MAHKFDDCRTCRFRRKRAHESPCEDCDVGEFYEDIDRAGIDAVFNEPATRFGESVITDQSSDDPPPMESPDE